MFAKNNSAKEKESIETPQPIGNKEVIEIKEVAQDRILESQHKAIAEKIANLESENIFVSFSNIGGAIKEVSIKNNGVFPVENFSTTDDSMLLEFDLKEKTKDVIVYKLISKGQEITKIYKLSKEENKINQETIVKNISTFPIVSIIDFNVLQINNNLVKKIDNQESGLYEYSVSSPQKTFRKSGAVKFFSKESKVEKDVVKWAGFRNKYYCAVFKPEFETESYKISPITEKILDISIQTRPISLNPGDQISLKGFYYFGPQDMKMLAKIGLGDYVVFSQYGILDFCSKIVLNIVDFLHKFVPSLGFCIILVSIIIYGIMYPLTMSGMVSMKKMQSLQPKIAKLKEQYKSNPQKLNQEVMALYKTNSINPLSGCLPFILQMPVFIGLYQALWRSVIFQGQGFLWIKDLSMPDRLFILPKEIPLIGNEINILPIFMMIAMFFQQKLSAKNMVITDETQMMQQKMMLWFFPIFLGVLFYHFASGINLYFTVFYILSTLSQLKMSKISVIKDEESSK